MQMQRQPEPDSIDACVASSVSPSARRTRRNHEGAGRRGTRAIWGVCMCARNETAPLVGPPLAGPGRAERAAQQHDRVVDDARASRQGGGASWRRRHAGAGRAVGVDLSDASCMLIPPHGSPIRELASCLERARIGEDARALL